MSVPSLVKYQPSKNLSVMGRRWDSTRPVFFQAAPGISLEEVVLEAIQRMRREGQYTRKQARVFLRVARCRVNGIEIPRNKWANTYPLAGSNIEILRGVKGGGSGKNPIATVLSAIVVAAATFATFWAGGAGGAAAATAMGISQAALQTGIAIASMAALYGINALFPAATPKLSSDSTSNSQAYSITGGQNAANPMGFVPLVLGKHRHTPPLGGKSWTTWEGDDQYFNMLVVWGHTDVAVSDFRIGETALGNFSGVEHLFHQATYGDDLKLFAKSYNEQSVGTVLKKSGGWVNRTVGDAEDLSIDIAFSGLATINSKTATVESRTVQFEAEYKKTSDTNWTRGFSGQRFPIAANVLTMNGVRDAEVGRVKVVTNGNGNLSIGINATGTAELWPTKSGFISCPVTGNVEYYTVEEGSGESAHNVTYANITVTVGAGYYDSIGTLTITEAKRTAVVKNYRVTNLERASYDIRIRRITDDTDSQYIIDEATWSTMRAILNQPAFNTPIPLCVSELRIKANEQLSGYVDNFNGLCQSVLPDWNGSAWVAGPTSNPAAIMRYLLTTRQGLSSPYTLGKMDDSALVALHEHCAANGYEFNFICDTEETTWSRLVAVLAPARAAPTTDVDGLWGAVIDHSGKEVKQLFTPRNSWGLKASRPFSNLPHALRVKFVDATQDYSQVEQFVYADGYSADGANGTKRATDIIEWDYPGVTSWEKIWRLARYHLAKILHRPISVTLNTDWEWLAVHRGDMVGVASDVLINTFGTARIQRLVYDIDGEEYMAGRKEDIPLDDDGKPLVPVGVQLDDTLVFSEPSPARYGIAIQDNTGRLTTHELKPEYGEERETLYFLAPPPAINIPQLWAHCSVSLFGQEYEEYLLASVTPGDNLSAELTLIPYAAEAIEAAATGAIPPYNPSVILDVVRGKALPTPVITAIRSDESVLVRAASGGTTPRIAAWWQLGATSADITNLTYQIMATDVETGVAVIGAASDIESFVAVANVTEGRVYAVRIRAVSGSTGRTSAWSTPVRHVVVGRTTPPPAPDAVNLDGHVIRIVQGNRPLDVVGHVVTMAFDADDGIGMGLTLTDPYTTTGTFDLSPWAGRARRVFVQTVDELGLLSEPVSIAIDLGDVMPDNVLFTLSERDTGWSGTTVNGFVDGGSLRAEETEYLWPQGADDDLWPQDGAFPLWPSGSGEQMAYSWRVVIPAMYSGSRIMVNPVAISGRLIALEYRFYSEPDLWPQNDAFLWPQNDDDYLWAQPSVTDWAAFPENYITHGRETLDLRVVYAGGTPAVLADIETIIDVKDREWAVKDLAIAADGTTHIPLPPETFRAVTNVQGTLQYFAGSTAMTLEHVPGTEAVGENGFLELGPVIRALNSGRALTLGKANVVLKGY